MHFWRTTTACKTYLGEHFDQVSAKYTFEVLKQVDLLQLLAGLQEMKKISYVALHTAILLDEFVTQ